MIVPALAEEPSPQSTLAENAEAGAVVSGTVKVATGPLTDSGTEPLKALTPAAVIVRSGFVYVKRSARSRSSRPKGW